MTYWAESTADHFLTWLNDVIQEQDEDVSLVGCIESWLLGAGKEWVSADYLTALQTAIVILARYAEDSDRYTYRDHDDQEQSFRRVWPRQSRLLDPSWFRWASRRQLT